MKEFDVFFRAFHEYKKQTAEDKQIKRLNRYVCNSSVDEDSLEAFRSYCEIEEDWIKIIEEGMEYVEKAIKQERQFIRKEGEVVPIEKMKHVSIDTVTHLAKHSELITREPDEDDLLTPEKLYMSENFSDFAVYENRFLYMLLCYVRDFIDLRLDKILELGRTFKMTAKVVKKVKMGKKEIDYIADMTFKDKDDPLTEKYSATDHLVQRIENMRALTQNLLDTPLMREVSKKPMIKPPITRTNVLRMNINFKKALELYCQLVEYNKDGYVIHKIKTTMRPFADQLIEEEAYILGLQQFLFYKYSNKLSDELWQSYLADQEKQKEQEKEKLAKMQELLKKRFEQDGQNVFDYISVLEKRVDDLLVAERDLKVAKTTIDNINQKIAELQQLKQIEESKCLQLQANFDAKQIEFANKINQIEEEKTAIEVKAQQDVLTAKEQLQKEFVQQKQDLFDQVEQIKQECQNQYTQLKTQLEQENDQIKQECQNTKTVLADEQQSKLLIKAQLDGLREQYGLIGADEDFVSKERFDELESELIALEKLLKRKWPEVKRKIKEDVLTKKLKKMHNKGQDDK